MSVVVVVVVVLVVVVHDLLFLLLGVAVAVEYIIFLILIIVVLFDFRPAHFCPTVQLESLCFLAPSFLQYEVTSRQILRLVLFYFSYTLVSWIWFSP